MMQNLTKIRLAISTCPNDTFAFHGILNRKVDLLGLDFQIELLDIQQLNEGLFQDRFDVAKASFHAAAILSDRTFVLPSGSALGFGVGPLLLSAKEGDSPGNALANLEFTRTLCPGEFTTAAMLFQLFYGEAIEAGKTRVEHQVFSDIMPSLKERAADFGVCIHEGRFTWADEGLFLVEDLGTRWEIETGVPLPLGGILARRGLAEETLARIQSVIRSSVVYGLEHRDETLPTMREFAQEFDDEVLMAHVELYVNDWTVDLGSEGRKALSVLSKKAIEQRIIPASQSAIEVYQARINRNL
jgi:1,4-dihydroxy-6-naphthoate synthase